MDASCAAVGVALAHISDAEVDDASARADAGCGIESAGHRTHSIVCGRTSRLRRPASSPRRRPRSSAGSAAHDQYLRLSAVGMWVAGGTWIADMGLYYIGR